MSTLDYYDVQAMIRDARAEIRGEIDNAVSDLRADVAAVADELREILAGLERTLQSRTEHLA